MAHSLEARVPLLDHSFVEFAATISAQLEKCVGGGPKHIFVKALRGWLPDEILDRPKQGKLRCTASTRWFRGPLRPLFREILLSDTCRRRGIFDEQFLHRLFARRGTGAPIGSLTSGRSCRLNSGAAGSWMGRACPPFGPLAFSTVIAPSRMGRPLAASRSPTPQTQAMIKTQRPPNIAMVAPTFAVPVDKPFKPRCWRIIYDGIDIPSTWCRSTRRFRAERAGSSDSVRPNGGTRRALSAHAAKAAACRCRGVTAASYWSFLLAPLPAIVAAHRWGSRSSYTIPAVKRTITLPIGDLSCIRG